ncbi:Ribokinase-like protein [Apiospora phragmitis]|uniref:Ribokinase-like protein n=1 Tax=Apiospora phragmitis TaxID=2905665 RepID=A0ABR1T4M8_9PEZI
MLNLVCVGACYLDTILSVPRFPEEDSKLRATSLSVRRGGNCPNSLEVLQQLLKAQEQQSHKVKPYLISCLPAAEAPASARVRDSFGPDSTVDFTRCIYREQHDQPASSYIIRSEATGTRTLVNYNDLPEMSVHEFQTAIEGLGHQDDMWVHFEGRIPETTLRCIQYLRQALPKTSISVEVEKPDREGLQELAAEADVVFHSKSWAESIGYQSARECLMAQSEVARRASKWDAGLCFCAHGVQRERQACRFQVRAACLACVTTWANCSRSRVCQHHKPAHNPSTAHTQASIQVS